MCLGGLEIYIKRVIMTSSGLFNTDANERGDDASNFDENGEDLL